MCIGWNVRHRTFLPKFFFSYFSRDIAEFLGDVGIFPSPVGFEIMFYIPLGGF
jgi:hypothetical protein